MFYTTELRTDQDRESKLSTLFQAIDGSESGQVSCQAFFNTIKSSDSNASDKLAQNIIKLADLDKDGYIGYSEFKSLFEPLPLTSINMRELIQYWSRNTTITDPKAIFENVWQKIISNNNGLDNVYLPREILFLAGAPGAGKGTQTTFVLEQRGINAPPVVMSTLLKSPSAQQIKSQGGLVGDSEVFTSLMMEITRDVYSGGVLIDGFPRSELQVDLIKQLYEKMNELQLEYNDTDLEKNFPRPRFRMIVFWIDENESVSRQLKRGRESMKHNLSVKETGSGKLIEVRATDVSMNSSKARYKNFIEHSYKSLSSLKDFFPYNLIDASGTVEQVQAIISHEMQYQSSLELSQKTYELLRKLPRASDITHSGRQSLVDRLDTYSEEYQDRLKHVIHTLNVEIYPVLKRHSLTGRAIVRSVNDIWKDPLHIDMAVDILCDREFEAVAETYPESIKFHINFKKGKY